MINVTKISEDNGLETYLIEGASLEPLVEECLKRIRQQSKAFYKESLREDLQRSQESHIDRHAGMGNLYKVKLKP